MCFKRKKKEEIDVKKLIEENELLKQKNKDLFDDLRRAAVDYDIKSDELLSANLYIKRLKYEYMEISNKLNSIKCIMDSINPGVRLNALKEIRELLHAVQVNEVTNNDQTGEN